ncbi:FAD/NAD(P)-binding domain-containing protein [Dioscorea alata]|uniref:FAD/NAD(P)-binding domain-containing protein n=1 Tax=Dioscorea alata TaxID=55571 RepID=A0ACB7VD47_DIOAL|nr:FAD/NAD(P)-binding domain-containing protein [Dioscorea alata]
MASSVRFPPSLLRATPNPSSAFLSSKPLIVPPRRVGVFRIQCSKRRGKQRYPSEKKKLRRMAETLVKSDIKNRKEGFWRLSKLGVPLSKDPGKDFVGVSPPLLEAIAKVLEFPVASMLPQEAFSIVRKSFDARKLLKEPEFVYTVDMDVKQLLELEPRTWDFIDRLEYKVGQVEYMPIVGSGPSGLFACLVLVELGAEVTLIERGQPVEQRGRDIGALVARRILQSDSNFCFGEVMKTLVRFGAPIDILIDGKPHLGTDRLIPLLRNFRHHLEELGVILKFSTRMDDLIVENKNVLGVKVSNVRQDPGSGSYNLFYDAVVLAVGHSARDVYQMLLHHNVGLIPKDFAVGLRIEHPQELINSMQYSALAAEVREGRGKVPVADYKLVKYVGEGNSDTSSDSGDQTRSCYSFCMCPGGQVVLTSTDPSELCINGMSFSRRASRWANAAVVVTVSSNDFDAFKCHGPLAGVEFQREFEKQAALMGGGSFVVPAQTVTDFLDNKLSVTSLPPSSYRLGVKAANLHNLYPASITQALQHSISMFDKELPGFISKDALLHGVETRTSAPLKISRHSDTYESTSLNRLYPTGEGAGYAGGIVSAAVDGMYCGFALAKKLNLFQGDIESILGKAQKNTGFVKY